MQKETTQSGRARAYTYLRDEVLPDPAAQGNFITEEEVANRIGGISRTPVREAFLLLGAEGLLELVPRHGAFVPPVRKQEIDEVHELRSLIESHALRSAIAKGKVPIAAMRQALDQQRQVVGEGSERRFNELDTEFHMALVRACGNSLLTKVYADLRTRQIRIGVRSLLASEDRQQSVIAEHEAIMAALESSSPERALSALQTHMDVTASALREV